MRNASVISNKDFLNKKFLLEITKGFRITGAYSDEATPVPIPNTAVKLINADGTMREAAWESRTVPVIVKPFFILR